MSCVSSILQYILSHKVGQSINQHAMQMFNGIRSKIHIFQYMEFNFGYKLFILLAEENSSREERLLFTRCFNQFFINM